MLCCSTTVHLFSIPLLMSNYLGFNGIGGQNQSGYTSNSIYYDESNTPKLNSNLDNLKNLATTTGAHAGVAFPFGLHPEETVPAHTSTPIASKVKVCYQFSSSGTGYADNPGNTAVQHSWIQRGTITTAQQLGHAIVEAFSDNIKYFLCGWTGCNHPFGFPQKYQLMTHIRSTHLQEKPFLCTTCRATFSRKQEAVRHVRSANTGKRFTCDICSKSFARRSYCNKHQALCSEQRNVGTSTWNLFDNDLR
ncbi:hypothetical protein K439DRAFT_1156241 [Ramaria rubella]|nr:hypothetical protein K439DRAFT_1156241 [Ramaria rubella]